MSTADSAFGKNAAGVDARDVSHMDILVTLAKARTGENAAGSAAIQGTRRPIVTLAKARGVHLARPLRKNPRQVDARLQPIIIRPEVSCRERRRND